MKRLLTMSVAASDGAVDGAGGAGDEGAAGGAGGGKATWRDGLDAGIKDHPALTRLADVPALAQSFLETKELVGKKGIIVPNESDPADVARFRKEIGVPETAEGYELGDFTPPEGLPWSEDLQKGMLGKLHAIGIPNGQIRQILDGYAEETNTQYTGIQKTAAAGHEAGQAALREEFGADYDASRALAERSFKAAAGEDFEELSHIMLPNGTALGDNPAFVRTFNNVGKQYQEAGLHGEKVGGGGFTMTPEAAKTEIAKLESHKALHDADHPEHAVVQKQITDLYAFAYPEEKPEVL